MIGSWSPASIGFADPGPIRVSPRARRTAPAGAVLLDWPGGQLDIEGGSSTASMTWMTPFEASKSAIVTTAA